MEAGYFNQIHWNNKLINIFEEYTAVVPGLLWKTVKHYQQIDSKRVVPCTPENQDWKATVKKIVVVLSHFTVLIPLAMYAGKYICRKAFPLQIVSPASLDSNKQQYLEAADEIRKLREDSHYIPQECQGPRHPIRFHLPVDPIVQEIDPELKNNLFNAFVLKHLPPELEAKRQMIISPEFNGFRSVHGVEADKGGIRNLLNLMVEGVLRAPYVGGLLDGPPEYVAGPHGPYYVILDASVWNNFKAIKRNGLWTEEAHVAFLVPQESDRQFLEKGLTKAIERGYITEDEKQRALRKVITYDEFIRLPYLVRHSESLLRIWLNSKS